MKDKIDPPAVALDENIDMCWDAEEDSWYLLRYDTDETSDYYPTQGAARQALANGAVKWGQ